MKIIRTTKPRYHLISCRAHALTGTNIPFSLTRKQRRKLLISVHPRSSGATFCRTRISRYTKPRLSLTRILCVLFPFTAFVYLCSIIPQIRPFVKRGKPALLAADKERPGRAEASRLVLFQSASISLITGRYSG